MAQFDMTLQPSDLNGLKTSSLLRLSKFATIDKDLIIGRLGSLDNEQIKILNSNLAKSFGINE